MIVLDAVAFLKSLSFRDRTMLAVSCLLFIGVISGPITKLLPLLSSVINHNQREEKTESGDGSENGNNRVLNTDMRDTCAKVNHH